MMVSLLYSPLLQPGLIARSGQIIEGEQPLLKHSDLCAHQSIYRVAKKGAENQGFYAMFTWLQEMYRGVGASSIKVQVMRILIGKQQESRETVYRDILNCRFKGHHKFLLSKCKKPES